ncbi:HpcH/HpaI aldolase/citrate lyase family protein [Oceanicella actignis]|uniref:Citrate lyase subunit beta / citryl-CoA lyase/(3S)-malyl-CoA thioesterase n=1 Tax=Oceanicella actignis TaxID=1189325 RepID=A0A1M7TAS2_9RHOB|nr:CoA ester lyase [Oceanicella actignis]SET52786.1 (3S)-malyl-CoA thioesterase [Oceanicella actignis]SHN67803.1 citrate lyase subunit beta / citryl-CoA lyase/(3S)-malyl-CoA thioesterase [Oceanicella actignis]
MTHPARIVRPRRSVLYMPGSKARALEKARSLPADSLILDLEDAVGPSDKAAAREMVARTVREGGFGHREVAVRINGLDTEWGAADLEAAAAAGPDAILVPKVGAPEDLLEVERRMTAAGAPESCAIWAMMETPQGVLAAERIAAATPRLACFVLGTNDLVKELGAEHVPGREPLLTALGMCLLAARAHGLACVDGVYNAYLDEEGLRAECLQGRRMGFDGKTLIHPAQLAVANELFAPSAEDLALARRQVEAYEQALAEGKGLAVVDGRIVENLHVETARALLAKAEAIARMQQG